MTPPEPLGESLADLWALDQAVTYLDHGHFGATPRAVLDAQDRWRRRLETRPIELLERRCDELLDRARLAVGRFVGAAPADLGFVTNATGGANAVLRSLRFSPGDELVTTNHVYNAVRQAMRHVAARDGASVIEVPVPIPVRSPDDVAAPIEAALGDRCRLLVVDHVSSPTAVLFPVERIVERAAARGIDVLVDGAHAPGMLDLDVEAVGCAWYTGNLHKWVCAPKGSAFLWARPDRQEGLHPAVISHFLGQGFGAEFAWQGTRDITPWLCAADAIAFMERFGWERVRRHNHELAVWAQEMLCRRLGAEPSTALDGSMTGSMATVALPPGASERYAGIGALQALLADRYRIEAPVIDWDGRWWIRVSCQVYNRPEQYERLAEALGELTAT